MCGVNPGGHESRCREALCIVPISQNLNLAGPSKVTLNKTTTDRETLLYSKRGADPHVQHGRVAGWCIHIYFGSGRVRRQIEEFPAFGRARWRAGWW